MPWSFVFVEFKSEKVAERNLKLLQAAKLRGRPLKVGYRGAKRADCPMTWREVQNELCVYGLPQGVPQHRVARLFPTATQVTTMAFYTLVVFESKEALVDALKNKACHSIDGCPLKFCYRLKADGKGKKRRSRKKREHGKLLDSNPHMSSKGALGKKHLKKEENITSAGNKLLQKKVGGAANARTSKAKFDAKRKEVKKLAAAARQRKV
ncbi:hypothetical protein V5799_013690 [Amblyomma americanum]|uniref:RRM domain-containing protein n=1 Tax=Amblyomma americanum TaxID=6943 RepID=A0AAQ4E554_AMBAM